MKNNSIFKIFLILIALVLTRFAKSETVFAYNERNVVCSGGSYFHLYGPSQYWTEFGGYGWCHNPNNWCENGLCSNQPPSNTPPFSMWRTYSGCSLSNYARWDMGNIGQWSYWYVFVPSHHATSIAPYSITYNGGNTYNFSLNQNNYYNRWVSLPTTQNFYQISSTWLSDNPCSSTREIGFDETEICHEADATSAYCPGSHNP